MGSEAFASASSVQETKPQQRFLMKLNQLLFRLGARKLAFLQFGVGLGSPDSHLMHAAPQQCGARHGKALSSALLLCLKYEHLNLTPFTQCFLKTQPDPRAHWMGAGRRPMQASRLPNKTCKTSSTHSLPLKPYKKQLTGTTFSRRVGLQRVLLGGGGTPKNLCWPLPGWHRVVSRVFSRGQEAPAA